LEIVEAMDDSTGYYEHMEKTIEAFSKRMNQFGSIPIRYFKNNEGSVLTLRESEKGMA
jgi:hypothetical protein